MRSARKKISRRSATAPNRWANPIPCPRNIDNALRYGLRGLKGGLSLAQLLDAERGVRNKQDLPPLTERQILAWAHAHRARTGRWPSAESGVIVDAPDETWKAIHLALVRGGRGLKGGSSLARLLRVRRLRPGQLKAAIRLHGIAARPEGAPENQARVR
jgi:hypothetical protein